ncbi:PrcB C-terminal [Solimonas aquatica]|uniref:PrcB C-terminal n=1 Tax=Solimonas aquatica TaxID=489703 RepID=A0A1H9LG03_9GAMM|nr:protease complex subunit PrcB family protein [Solimonas aquatica]SER10421.1 PrcB C-terminal [Solimonas aquatica]
MKRALLLLLVLPLSACSTLVGLFVPARAVTVVEAGRSQFCPASSEKLSAQFFITAEAVLNYEAQAGVDLHPGEPLPPASYVLIGMGQRPSGGYGLLVDPSAYVDGDVARLHVTAITPRPDSAPPPEPSSPCLLVRLPAGEWRGAAVYDENGSRRAKTYRY